MAGENSTTEPPVPLQTRVMNLLDMFKHLKKFSEFSQTSSFLVYSSKLMILKTLQKIILDNMRYTSNFIFEKKNRHIRDSTGEGRATNPSFLQS